MNNPTYIFAQIAVKDYKTYLAQYGAPFLPILEKYQGELLAGNKEGKILEGEPFGNWAVLLKFPSAELADAFVNSEEYAPLKDLRINELTTANQIILLSSKIGL